MKIYTKTGDDGQTGLFGGPRVAKDDARIEAYGTVDELNSTIGVARAESPSDDLDGTLGRIQHELFQLGAELATPDPVRQASRLLSAEHIAWLEASIDGTEARLEPLREFILPGGTLLAALLHQARTVCRRAERRLVTLADKAPGTVRPELVIYLNRLSDLFFVLARAANSDAGVGDVAWRKASG